MEKVALVTGASSGIGRATAALLAGSDYRVFGAARNIASVKPIANVEFLQLDVRDNESVKEAVHAILSLAGRIDALVNNAGYTLIGSLEETSMEEAKQLFETNFFGVLRMSQAVLPIMRGQGYGRIANVSSVVGFLPAPYQGIYGASKHALEGYSESLDHEVRQFGIRVSVIEPGFTRTKISQNSQVAGRLLEAYESERKRVLDAVRENTASGEHSFTAASAVLKALTARSPRPRYPVGREAKLLSRFRKLIPSKLFDKSLRKQFGLGTA